MSEPDYDAMYEASLWPLLDRPLEDQIKEDRPELWPAYEEWIEQSRSWVGFQDAAIKAGYEWWIDSIWDRSHEIKKERLNQPAYVPEEGDDTAF